MPKSRLKIIDFEALGARTRSNPELCADKQGHNCAALPEQYVSPIYSID